MAAYLSESIRLGFPIAVLASHFFCTTEAEDFSSDPA